MTMHILVADDIKDLRDLIRFNLEGEGYSVSCAENGLEALDMIKKKKPDLLVMDIMMPGMRGLDVLAELKKKSDTWDIPVILLTAKDTELDKVLGLEMGAEDYITKPFSGRELVARVKVIFRRAVAAAPCESIIQIGNLRVDLEKNKVYLEEKIIELSNTEFKLLIYLARNKGRIISRDNLLEHVWENNENVESRTIDVHIRRLRSKLEKDPRNPVLIKTFRGIGYEMVE